MALCSIVVPFYSTPRTEEAHLLAVSSEDLGVPADCIELYKLVPLSGASPSQQYAVKLKNSQLSVHSIEQLLTDYARLQQQLDQCREALVTYKDYSLHAALAVKAQAKVEKLKKVNEDNKKLRQLLKKQLENSESLRQETQNTVDTLRAEFERLVHKMHAATRVRPPQAPEARRAKFK